MKIPVLVRFFKLHVLLCFSFTRKRKIGFGGIHLQSMEKMTIYEYVRTTKCFQFCHLSAVTGDLHHRRLGDRSEFWTLKQENKDYNTDNLSFFFQNEKMKRFSSS